MKPLWGKDRSIPFSANRVALFPNGYSLVIPFSSTIVTQVYQTSSFYLCANTDFCKRFKWFSILFSGLLTKAFSLKTFDKDRKYRLFRHALMKAISESALLVELTFFGLIILCTDQGGTHDEKRTQEQRRLARHVRPKERFRREQREERIQQRFLLERGRLHENQAFLSGAKQHIVGSNPQQNKNHVDAKASTFFFLWHK